MAVRMRVREFECIEKHGGYPNPHYSIFKGEKFEVRGTWWRWCPGYSRATRPFNSWHDFAKFSKYFKEITDHSIPY